MDMVKKLQEKIKKVRTETQERKDMDTIHLLQPHDKESYLYI